MAHTYVGIEDLDLTISQRQTLVAWLRSLGPASAPQPAHLCHWRTRMDDRAAIFEAMFDEDSVSVLGIRNRLAAIFGVAPETITYDVTQTAYGPLVTYARNGDKLRMIQFGGASPSWAESGDAARAYLAANAAAWGDV